MKSSIQLTPDIADELGLKEGDSFELCVKGTVVSANENGMAGEITSAETDADEDKDEAETDGAPAAAGGKTPVDKLLSSEQDQD